MDDDWASPWADADDRSSTEVIKNLDSQDAEDAARSGGNEPEPRIPNSNVAVHTNDPWGGGEHGFGDVSAWASSSPGIGVGEIPAVRGGPALPAWNEPILVEVPSFIVEKAKDERGSSNAIGITVPQTGTGKTGEWFGGGIHGTSSNLPIATDEADVWATGSDWGDTKSERTEDFPVERTDLSPEIAPENIPLPEFDALVEGVNDDTKVLTESSKEYQFVGTTILDQEPTKHKNEIDSNEEPIDSVKVSIEDITTIPEPRSNDDQNPAQEGVPEEKAGVVGDKIEEKDINEEEPVNEDEEDDDDFGDFADEENFEDAEENFTQDAPASFDELPPLPPTPGLRPDITFDIQTSLVNKLYPIFTTYPKPPPIEELIHTTESRKAWYRLSQSGTIRKDKSGDDDYVRVTWHGSRVQEDVNKIVGRWMAEDRSSGTGVALGGSRRLGAMFGWGEGVESIEKKATPAQSSLTKTNSPDRSNIGALGSVQGATKPPFGISTTTTRLVEKDVASSPQTTSFGWSSMDNAQLATESHPSSSAGSTRGEDKPPSTPSRGSFYGTPGPSRMSSQLVTPSKSTKPHSPISSNHSRKTSHSLALTQPSSPSHQGIRRSAEVTKTTIPPTRVDSPFSSSLAASRSTAPITAPDTVTTSAPSPNFDEWGAFEDMATTAKLPSTKEANRNFDDWGGLEDTTKAVDTKPINEISVQNQISEPPVKVSGIEEKSIGSKEDEWSAFEEPVDISKAASLDGSSKRLSAHVPTKLEKRSDSKGGIDDLDSLATFGGPLTIKASISDKSLNISLVNIPGGLYAKPIISASSSVQKTEDWGSFDAFESSLASKPPISILPATNVVKELKSIPAEASSQKVQNAHNWGSFEAFESTLTSKPSVPNQSLKITTMQPPKESNAKPAGLNQKIDNWGSFDTSRKPQSKAVSNFNLPALSISNGTATKPNIRSAPPPILPAPVVTEDDDDDWGEMVQSPQIPNGSSSFGFVMQPTSSITPRTMSPAPPQSMQPQPQPQPQSQPQAATSTMSMYDFGNFETRMSVPASTSKPTNGGGTDTWDLSFFDGPASSNKTPINVSASTSSNQPSHDLWDAPAPAVTGRRLNAKELEEDKVVNSIVEGLPDLSYMLS